MTIRLSRSALVAAFATILSLGGGAAVSIGQTGVFVSVGVIDGRADLVRVRDGLAYVVGGRTFTIYDVSDPSLPVRLGSHELPEEIWGFRIAGDRAYIGNNFSGLALLDISNPRAPEVLGVHKTLGQTKIGAAVGSKVGLIDHMEGFVLIDVSNERAPEGIGSFYLDGYARDAVTLGTMAYAVDSPSGLYIFDLSRDGEPEPVAVLHGPSAPRFIEAVAIEGGPTLVAGAGGGNLQVYDVTDPTAPVRAPSFETPGQVVRISFRRATAFVADGPAGFHLVDLADPSSPTLVASHSTARAVWDIAATDTHVFIVTGDSEREGEDRHVEILERK
jgi:hypothetical protein